MFATLVEQSMAEVTEGSQQLLKVLRLAEAQKHTIALPLISYQPSPDRTCVASWLQRIVRDFHILPSTTSVGNAS